MLGSVGGYFSPSEGSSASSCGCLFSGEGQQRTNSVSVALPAHATTLTSSFDSIWHLLLGLTAVN